MAMSTAERSYHGPFTLDDFRAIIHRRLRELAGLALIAVACGAAAALATWSVKDPSLSHATSAPVRNLLGAPGRHRGRPRDPAVRPRHHRHHRADRGMGLAAVHPSPARPDALAPAGLADRPRRRGRLCLVPGTHAAMAAADRHRRRHRRCGDSRHRLRGRRAAVRNRPHGGRGIVRHHRSGHAGHHVGLRLPTVRRRPGCGGRGRRGGRRATRAARFRSAGWCITSSA